MRRARYHRCLATTLLLCNTASVTSEIAIIISSGALSLAGVAFAIFAATLARRAADFIAVAAGVILLLVAVFHLAPEALASGGVELAFLIGGAAVGAVLELALHSRTSPQAQEMNRAAALLGVLVLALHSLLDGAVYTAAFWHGSETGLLTSLGLILHEAPEGVVAVMLCLQAGLKPLSAAVVATVASTVTTPLGWALAHALGTEGDDVMKAMFAASAGLLLYVGWHLIATGWRAIRARRG